MIFKKKRSNKGSVAATSDAGRSRKTDKKSDVMKQMSEQIFNEADNMNNDDQGD